MKIVIDRNKCVLCAMCVVEAAEYFDFADDGDTAKVIKEDIVPTDLKHIIEVINLCQGNAIKILK